MKLRDELADKVNKHFEKIGANTDDVFKYGFGVCEAHYLPMIEKLESALKYTMRDGNRPFLTLDNQQQINEALAELEQFKNKMNGGEK